MTFTYFLKFKKKAKRSNDDGGGFRINRDNSIQKKTKKNIIGGKTEKN